MQFMSDELVFVTAETTDPPPALAAATEDAFFTGAEIDAVRASWAAATPVNAKAADAFFENLFDAYPNLQGPFHVSGGPPKTMLWATVGLIVDNLEDPESLSLPLRQLGARHVALGVQDDMLSLIHI